MSDISDGQNRPNEIVLASWSHRFIAWLIDVAIVSVAVWSIGFASSVPAFDGDAESWLRNVDPLPFITSSLVYFAYWTLLESSRGQSIGKMALHLKTTDLSGKTADIKSVAIQSFGKSFLLVIDCILGWIFTNEKRQRIFNRASQTIVIKVKKNEDGDSTQNISYRKD